MDKWPYGVMKLQTQQIQQAISDQKWQEFRNSLKGLSTQEKLDKLEDYMMEGRVGGRISEIVSTRKVRVDNYVNALRRGGQLDSHYKVVK